MIFAVVRKGKPMRLFDTDELKEWVENWFEKNRSYHPYSKANNIPIPELYDILESMPAVDAEPVKHAHWIMKPNGYGTCSNCLTCSLDIMGGVDSNYCPNCGAKMDAPTQKSVGKALKALEVNENGND